MFRAELNIDIQREYLGQERDIKYSDRRSVVCWETQGACSWMSLDVPGCPWMSLDVTPVREEVSALDDG